MEWSFDILLVFVFCCGTCGPILGELLFYLVYGVLVSLALLCVVWEGIFLWCHGSRACVVGTF